MRVFWAIAVIVWNIGTGVAHWVITVFPVVTEAIYSVVTTLCGSALFIVTASGATVNDSGPCLHAAQFVWRF